MKRLALILTLTLSACVPGASKLPDPLPILFPDGTLTQKDGILTLGNLESNPLLDPSVYLEGEDFAPLEPNLWGCTPYAPGWQCLKAPPLEPGKSSSMKFSGTLRIGNVAYYLVDNSGTLKLAIKSLKR